MGLAVLALAAVLAVPPTVLAAPPPKTLAHLRLVDEKGRPFELRVPFLEEESLETLAAGGRRLPNSFFLPLDSARYDSHYVEPGFRMGDAVTNTLLFVGGAALLGTIIADFLRTH